MTSTVANNIEVTMTSTVATKPEFSDFDEDAVNQRLAIWKRFILRAEYKLLVSDQEIETHLAMDRSSDDWVKIMKDLVDKRFEYIREKLIEGNKKVKMLELAWSIYSELYGLSKYPASHGYSEFADEIEQVRGETIYLWELCCKRFCVDDDWVDEMIITDRCEFGDTKYGINMEYVANEWKDYL